MAIFLKPFEKELKFLKVPDSQWVAYLIGALPGDIATLIARETEDEAQNYAHVKEFLLRRLKFSAEKIQTLRIRRPSVTCYGCDKPDVTKPRCPNCKPTVKKDSANFSNISLHSCSSTLNQSTVLKLSVNGTWGTACADTGASHTIA
ncbi:hypothetical protein NPIL_696911 [Nephila pilipes]|uniref:Peptidase A2 domain-containing protein n=1 Tax=Nephila pilipes TaxID=299642 RepID=A0A8X6PHF2_NEPPI|nr:hypothetical protein NPIL_696911 [Nephila pilipes]